jgi:hypothetical protein
MSAVRQVGDDQADCAKPDDDEQDGGPLELGFLSDAHIG